MKYKLILGAIILVAAILRLFELGQTPRGLYLDEPSIGYNAYSIIKTGKDEHGVSFPLAFQAYGEYKLPGYIYASTPFIAAFGLSAFSTRLLSAIAGVAGVFAIYLFTYELLKTEFRNTARRIGIIAATLWAVSPWSIQLSRGAFESNLMLTLTVFGLYFLLKYLTSHKRVHIAAAAVLLIASFYTYNAGRLFIPIFLIIITFIYLKSLPKLKTSIALAVIVAVMIPGFLGITGGQGGQRIQQVFELENKEYLLGPVLGVTQKYLTHLSPNFLFFEGDTTTPRHSLQELGMFHYPELLTIALGLLVFTRSRTRYKLFLFVWLLLAPLPAALATPVPHALRAILLLPPLLIFSALGVDALIRLINTRIPFKHIRYATLLLLILASAYSFYTYLHVYYQHYKYRTSWDWNEHQTRLAEHLATKYSNHQQKFIVEGGPETLIYIKFFNASKNQSTDESKYIFTENPGIAAPANGDIVAVSGWKGAPGELKDVTELKMMNDSTGYKVGRWEK